MDVISPSFCGAKWFEGTIWLYRGATASCHHNPFHKIALDPNNPASLHNTHQKISEREAMLNGEKPNGCNYCWSVEHEGGVSDRIIKTQAMPKGTLLNWAKDGMQLTGTPYMLEVAFERTCNLACAYCGPSFSSKWASDIKKFGPYENIATDSRYAVDNSPDIINPENNPYLEAFLKWWPELESKLTWMRVTGGEPLMSPGFWRFIDLLGQRNSFKGLLSINTNLIAHKDEVERLIAKTNGMKIKIHTSIESDFLATEYVRDGFIKETWYNNVHKILDNTNAVLNLTTCINNMGVWGFLDYLKLTQHLKKKYGKDRIETSVNFAHYPIFMRVQLIPLEMRKQIADDVAQWVNDTEANQLFHDSEVAHIQRFITILSTAPVAITESYVTIEQCLSDVKEFIAQYDKRRNQNFRESLDERFINWYDSI